MQIVPRRTIVVMGLLRALLAVIAIVAARMHPGSSSGSFELIAACYSILTAAVEWALIARMVVVLQPISWLLDLFFLRLVLARFSHHGTVAPAFLPLIAFEAELYWPGWGMRVGAVAAGLMLVSTWWLRLWSHRPTLSIEWLGLWLVYLAAAVIVVSQLSGVERADLGRNIELRRTPEEPSHGASGADFLTPREKEVLEALQDGKTLYAIARELHISYSTAKSHWRKIAAKLKTPGDKPRP
ncbi:helix-turn-helix transcriptional regulator [Sulfobacillus harzensis]|uniref:Response regulator transcription factor n=1 Tax=Sulfobacillus harzensis TaxID=2729629 RepID=A0A7Y0L819_9FIRM|nr:LuxR C-terminal-related transcriptional regulator [Sulfobacillus harzensis]NMP24476.1 response regulator transcription factor [Sulfobacillus harzensis]